MKMQKFTALTCGLVLCLGLSACGEENNNLPDELSTLSLVAYDAEKDNDYTIDYKVTDEMTVNPFDVAYAYEDAVVIEAYGKEAIIQNMTVDTSGKITIDFKKDAVTDLSLGSGAEAAVFENLAESIVLNCPQITSIYYTMDGGNFETGHLSFDADKAIWTKAQD